MCRFSIIIPVYNSEKYISKCIKSWLNQTFKDFELIIIDDGSVDDTFDIVNDLKKNDKRIHIYRKKNGGVSAARNLGLNFAEGELIGFCDADDLVSDIMLAQVNDAFEDKEIDIVQVSYTKNILKLSHKFMNYNHKVSVNKFRREVLFNSNVMGSVWNKFFKVELVKDYRFNEKLTHCEDMEWIIRILNSTTINKIGQINNLLYFYNKNNENATTATFKNQIDDRGRLKYLDAFYEMYYQIDNKHKNLIKTNIYSWSLANLVLKDYGVEYTLDVKRELKRNIHLCGIYYYLNVDISIKDKIRSVRRYLKYRNNLK